MHFVYILYSEKIDKFYSGETPDFEARLKIHNDPKRNTNSTKIGIPWAEFWKLEVESLTVAKRIERHIKNMKSRKYYGDLKKYPEIAEKLIRKYSK